MILCRRLNLRVIIAQRSDCSFALNHHHPSHLPSYIPRKPSCKLFISVTRVSVLLVQRRSLANRSSIHDVAWRVGDVRVMGWTGLIVSFGDILIGWDGNQGLQSSAGWLEMSG
jgi:hypothetical protein